MIVFAVPQAEATTISAEGMRTTFHRADAVIEGDVIDVRVEPFDEGLPITVYTVQVLDALKGDVRGVLELRVLGGWTESAYVYVHGAPGMWRDDRIIESVR